LSFIFCLHGYRAPPPPLSRALLLSPTVYLSPTLSFLNLSTGLSNCLRSAKTTYTVHIFVPLQFFSVFLTMTSSAEYIEFFNIFYLSLGNHLAMPSFVVNVSPSTITTINTIHVILSIKKTKKNQNLSPSAPHLLICLCRQI
jgi:hypothetical protein